jgi:hypothetical protein
VKLTDEAGNTQSEKLAVKLKRWGGAPPQSGREPHPLPIRAS